MPLKKFKCPICEKTKETLKNKVPECEMEHKKVKMEKVMTAPGTKFMETINPATNKKREKDLHRQLKARSRKHARDVEADELIQLNKANDLVKSTLLNKDGKRRKKVDDI